MSKKIIAIKLINGEEYIGEVEVETDNYIILYKPRALQFNPAGTSAALVPAIIMGVDGEVKFYKSAIAVRSDNVPVEFEENYLQAVSGITLAKTLNG